MKILKKLYLILFASVYFLSCSFSDTDSIDDSWTYTIQEKIPFVYSIPSDHEAYSTYRWKNLDESEAVAARMLNQELLIEGYQIVQPLLDEINSDESALDQVLKSAKQIFEINSNSRALFMAEQIFAMRIQRNFFPDLHSKDINQISIEKPLEKSEIKALKASIELLLKNENPNADLIKLNIAVLNNSLPDELIKEYAAKVINNAESWYGEALLRKGKLTETDQGVKFRQVYESVQFLREEYLL